MKKYPLLITILATIIFASCNSDKNNDKKTNNDDIVKIDTTTKQIKKLNNIVVSSPLENESYKIGEKININFSLKDKFKIDSVKYFIDGKSIISNKANEITLSTDSLKVGKHKIKIVCFYNSKKERKRISVILKSDIIPKKLSYKVIKKYKHDKASYTQGLIYKDGFLYEGTGQWRESMLRKEKLENNELIQSYSLPDNVFGEGIVIVDDKIIQLTWQSKTAYRYDLNSFKLLNTFNYQTEGWGITNYGDNLIMSDGSNKLYILEKDFFTKIGEIEVFDDNGPVNYLNELENVNGKIYANIYQSNYIVEINPRTGKVISKLDLTELVPVEYKNDEDNVLNGIAYNNKNKYFYITGKRWAVLYELEILDK